MRQLVTNPDEIDDNKIPEEERDRFWLQIIEGILSNINNEIQESLQKLDKKEITSEQYFSGLAEYAQHFRVIGKIVSEKISARTDNMRMDNLYEIHWHGLEGLSNLPQGFGTDKRAFYKFEKAMLDYICTQEVVSMHEDITKLIDKETSAINRRKRELEVSIINEVLADHTVFIDEDKRKAVRCIDINALSSTVKVFHKRKRLLGLIKLSDKEKSDRNRIAKETLPDDLILKYEEKVKKFKSYIELRKDDFAQKSIPYKKYKQTDSLEFENTTVENQINYFDPSKPLPKKGKSKKAYLEEIDQIEKTYEDLKKNKEIFTSKGDRASKNDYLNVLSSIVGRMQDFIESDVGNFTPTEVFSFVKNLDEKVIQTKKVSPSEAPEDQAKEKKKSLEIKNKYLGLTAFLVVSTIDELTEQCKSLNFDKSKNPEIVINQIAQMGELVKNLPEELQREFCLDSFALCRDFAWHRQHSILKIDRYNAIIQNPNFLQALVVEINQLASVLPKVKGKYIVMYEEVCGKRRTGDKKTPQKEIDLTAWKTGVDFKVFNELSDALEFIKLRFAITKVTKNLKLYNSLLTSKKVVDPKELELCLTEIGQSIGLIFGGHRLDFDKKEEKILKLVLDKHSKMYKILDEFRETANTFRHFTPGGQRYETQRKKLHALLGEGDLVKQADELVGKTEEKIKESLQGPQKELSFDEELAEAWELQKALTSDEKKKVLLKKN